MSEHEAKSNHVRMKPRMLLLLAALLLVIIAALIIVMNRSSIGVALSSGHRAGGNRKPFTYASAAQIEADAVGNGLAIVSNNGMELLDSGGRLAMKKPAVTASTSSAAAFDIGNTNLIIGDLHGASHVLKLKQNILTASMNDNGYLAVCTESSGYHGEVTVYNPQAQEVYRWYSGEAYLLTAQVSPDNRYLATLCVGSKGGSVHIMRLDSPDEVAQYEAEDTVVTDLRWLENNRIFLLEREKCTVIGRDGRAVGSLEFGDKVVTAFSYGDGFAAVMLCDYISGKNGTLISVGPDCTILGQVAVTTGLQALDAYRGSVGLLCGDGVHKYTKTMSKGGNADSEAGVIDLVMRYNSDVFLITQNTALIRNF